MSPKEFEARIGEITDLMELEGMSIWAISASNSNYDLYADCRKFRSFLLDDWKKMPKLISGMIDDCSTMNTITNDKIVEELKKLTSRILSKLIRLGEFEIKESNGIYPLRPSNATKNAHRLIEIIEYEINQLKQNTNKPKAKKIMAEALKYDPNYWNQEGFDLFKYLASEYDMKAKIQKFTNIWFYMEYDTADNIRFDYKKDDYKKFVTKNFDFDFSKSKMNKPGNYDDQLIILNRHYSTYVMRLKEDK